jgi:hypothetical protein
VPYYRILVFTKKQAKPFAGVRWIDNASVDNVYRMYDTKSREKFKGDYLDLEVQMLSKLCRAVLEHVELEERKRRQNEVAKKY